MVGVKLVLIIGSGASEISSARNDRKSTQSTGLLTAGTHERKKDENAFGFRKREF